MLEKIDGKAQCSQYACDYVHVFDFCYDWMMATKACKFASVRRSLNLERLSGNKSLACINADGAADMFVNWRARHGRKSKVLQTDTLTGPLVEPLKPLETFILVGIL